ncbi:hypothetical protein CMI37_34775 [Candidatus Pacearchaeota archaeon]|nr:hypothetical protein [Candidatus Pacearchaeota archaeon]
MPKSIAKVTEQFAQLERHYQPTHDHMRKVERMVEQRYDGLIDVPYEVRIFRSSTSANIVSGFRNQIRTHEPTVNFTPFGLGKPALRHGTLMQRWGYAMLKRERENSDMDPNLQLALDLISRGAACKKIIVDVDQMMLKAPNSNRGLAMREWEAKGMKNWPFVSRAVDPLAIFIAPGQDKPPQMLIEKQIRYAGEISRRYPSWIDPHQGKKTWNPARPVVWLEYWTPDEYTVEADGELVFEKDNPTMMKGVEGIVPYIFDWAGLGRHHVDGDPRHMGVTLLSEILGELEEEVRLKTAISVQTQMHVFPPILTVEDPKKVAKQFGVGPGKVIRHLPNHPPEYMQYPPPNENMYRFLDAIQQNILRVAGSALRGGRDAGVQFGVLQAQLIGQELTTIAPIRATLDRMGTQTLNMMARLMKSYDISMAIEGSAEPAVETGRVTGKDFSHFNFDVTFEAVDPAENDRMLLVGEALRRAGDISRHTFHKKYAKHVVEDPDFEAVLIYAERVLEQAIEQGVLLGVVLDDDVLNQLANEAVDTAASAAGFAAEQQNTDVSGEARSRAQELEAISGRPGSSTIPRETAEQGMENSRG